MEDRRKRSRSYPGYDLEQCIRWAEQLRAELGSGPHDRQTIARALGSTGLTGASTRKIGAMAHFGLLGRASGGYSFTPLSERIARPVSDNERRDAIIEAFLQPELYRELIERFTPDGHVPARLANILVRDHGIEVSAAQEAAKVFLSSGRFAGAVDDDGRISREIPQPERREAQQLEIPYSPERRAPAPEPPAQTTPEQHFRFSLTAGRFASLNVPLGLNARDVRLIQKQVELLALQAEMAEIEGEETRRG